MSPNAAEDLFRIEDFDGIEIKIQVENRTSKTGVRGNRRVLGSVVVPIDEATSVVRLMGIGEETISLDCPTRTAALGHTLNCVVDVAGITPPVHIELLGTVAAVIKLEDQRDRIDLDLTSSSVKELEPLRNLHASKQREIDEFLKAMKR